MTATAQEYAPLHRTAPDWAATDGDLALQLAADLGWSLDEVQGWTVDGCLAVAGDGLPAAREVCIVGPRQTVGKTVALEVAALFEAFVAELPLHVWTAHRYSTARKTYEDMKKRIERNRDYVARCDFQETTGEQAIVVDGAYRIEFHARSGAKAGRGFTTPRLTLDEWLFGRPGDLGGLAPTIVTMPEAQIRYASSAGMLGSGPLRAIRKRGRAGDPRLAYQELGATWRPCAAGDGCRHDLDDPTCALNDRGLWWQANSGLWCGRVREADVADQRRLLEPREFAREFLSWWEDPPNEEGGALDLAAFAALADPQAVRGRPVSFGVAVAPDRSWAAIQAAWPAGGGVVQTVKVDYRPHTAWVPERVDEVRARWGGRVVADSRARAMFPDPPPSWLGEPSEVDQALAEATLSDRITAGTVRHGNEPELLTAARGAMWRQSGAHRRLEPAGQIDVSPLRAAALAVHAASATIDPLSQLW